jgi:hypothetical protein
MGLPMNPVDARYIADWSHWEELEVSESSPNDFALIACDCVVPQQITMFVWQSTGEDRAERVDAV